MNARHLTSWLVAGLFVSHVTRAAESLSTPFFPFCIDWHDAKKRSLEQQAVLLKELGYPGVGHIYLDKVEERLSSLDAVGLRLYSITMTVELGPDKPPYDAARFREVLALVKGRGVQFWLLVSGGKPSDPAFDDLAVRVLHHMSDEARDSGAQLLLYPHLGSWIERIEDSLRVAEKTDRPNVGVMFNLCHWLRVDASRDYRSLLDKALPRLRAVSINGADDFDPQPGWSRYIQPLDEGSFDVGSFLRTLHELGYRGPVGLQCYGIGGDVGEHLAASKRAWAQLNASLDARPIRVLIVTGMDYPGHHWWKTTPVLETNLTTDSRVRVEVLKDPYRLGAEDLSRHDVLLLHFMNWEKSDPDEAVRENLRRFVERGGGLVVIHFACGAFPGWPEYAALIGRVYDRTNTHDPRGPFTVNIVNTNHPITRGLGASFETDDELYICLTGDKPIQLLATARSKVTRSDHPMGFVHRYGQGRVFLTPLGHDARALEAQGTAELIRRATAWAAGREPIPAQTSKSTAPSPPLSAPEP
jgi:sugar phosphate isomerase/epimerase/type 1 glutamine amidotransferase